MFYLEHTDPKNSFLDAKLDTAVFNLHTRFWVMNGYQFYLDNLKILDRFITYTRPVDAFDSLSRREQEVFLLLAGGKSIREIANELFISPKTVESHKYHIMKKLEAASVVDLTKIAIRKNLIKV